MQRCDPVAVKQPANQPQQRVSNFSILIDAVVQATVEKQGELILGPRAPSPATVRTRLKQGFQLISNIFMTIACYEHPKPKTRSLIILIINSWAIGLLEYIFQVSVRRLRSLS